MKRDETTGLTEEQLRKVLADNPEDPEEARRIKELLLVIQELAERPRVDPNRRTAEQAYQEFVKYYLPAEGDLMDPTGVELTPSYHGELCLGNGEYPQYECCCDECDYYLVCFPDYDCF